ncbi:MAG: phage antirepressor [Paraclostridium sp.]
MNLITIKNVRGYVENDKVFLHIEDVARGLGFTENKGSSSYVMWRRVNKYLESLSTQVPKDGFIPENIFYKLCMKADNEVARKFQDLVCDEILPSIRKNGGYIISSEEDDDEDIMARALLVAQKTIEKKNNKIKELEIKVEEDKPKVEYYDKVLDSVSTFTTTQIAKEVGFSAMGLNLLLQTLGVQFKQSGQWLLK